jgi:hypothetical protein
LSSSGEFLVESFNLESQSRFLLIESVLRLESSSHLALESSDIPHFTRDASFMSLDDLFQLILLKAGLAQVIL